MIESASDTTSMSDEPVRKTIASFNAARPSVRAQFGTGNVVELPDGRCLLVLAGAATLAARADACQIASVASESSNVLN